MFTAILGHFLKKLRPVLIDEEYSLVFAAVFLDLVLALGFIWCVFKLFKSCMGV